MDLSFDITALGIVVMVIGAVVYGLSLALVGEVRIGYEWLLTALAAFLGAFVASEYLTLQSFAPVWEGIALVPAVIGGAVTGLVVDLITRFASGGSLTHGPHPV